MSSQPPAPEGSADRGGNRPETAAVHGFGRRVLSGSLPLFAAAAVLSSAIHVGGTTALTEGFGVPPERGLIAAMAVGTAFNFLFSRFVVFRGTVVPWRRQLAGYLAGSLFFRGAEYAGFRALYDGVQTPYPVAIFLAQTVSFVAKFFFYRAVVFARPRGLPRTAGER